MATVSINSEQITSIANSLKSKGEQILNKYKGDCASALQMSNQCLQLSGLDTDQIFKSMENVYTKLNERVASLADFLTNTIAAEYDVLSQSISNSFNNDFANEFGALIGIGGAASGGKTGIPIRVPVDPELRQPVEMIKNGEFKKLPSSEGPGVSEYLGDGSGQVELATIDGKNNSVASLLSRSDALDARRLELQKPSADATIQPVKMFNPIDRKASITLPGFVPGTRNAQISSENSGQFFTRSGAIGVDTVIDE